MSFLENFVSQYGLPAIFFCILLEYACFPVSSEIVLPLSGLLAANQNLPFPLLVAFSTIAGVMGSLFTYFVGRFGGSPLLERIMKRFPSMESPILASYRTFGNHGKAAIFFSRLIPLCRTYIGFIAGAMKQGFCRYVLYSAFGILIWNTILTGLGYYFYQYKDLFFSYFDRYKHWIFRGGLIVLALLAFVHIKKQRKQSEKEQEE